MSESTATILAATDSVDRDERQTVTALPKPHLVIEPAKGWRSLRLRDLWEFRDLITTLGMRDLLTIALATLPAKHRPIVKIRLFGAEIVKLRAQLSIKLNYKLTLLGVDWVVLQL